MSHIGFRSRIDLDGKAFSEKSFSGVIRTNGITVEFICELPSHVAEATLTPVDIAIELVSNSATIYGVKFATIESQTLSKQC